MKLQYQVPGLAYDLDVAYPLFSKEVFVPSVIPELNLEVERLSWPKHLYKTVVQESVFPYL